MVEWGLDLQYGWRMVSDWGLTRVLGWVRGFEHMWGSRFEGLTGMLTGFNLGFVVGV